MSTILLFPAGDASDRSPAAERKCSDLLFNPAPHSPGIPAAIPSQERQRKRQKQFQHVEAVERGRVRAGFILTFNASQAATNSDRHVLLSVTMKPGETGSSHNSLSPPAPLHTPWTITRERWWA